MIANKITEARREDDLYCIAIENDSVYVKSLSSDDIFTKLTDTINKMDLWGILFDADIMFTRKHTNDIKSHY